MAKMNEIRERIKSINDIKKITNAMYLISSSKLKKARKDLDATEPYFDKLLYAMRSILSRVPEEAEELTFFDEREHIPQEKRKQALLIITADKGMCGAYNHNVIEKAEAVMSETGMNYLYVMGQVGRMYFQRKAKAENIELAESFFYTTQNPTLYSARSIAEELMEKFRSGEVDDVYMVYTDMQKASEYEVRIQQILPLDVTHFVPVGEEAAKHHEAEFFPDIESVMRHLIPNFMKGLIYGAMVESFCSEQQARMTAMDSATTSAKDMLSTLSLQYNRARQAAITQEISEICGNSLK